MKDRLLLILNPISGRLRGVANEEALCQALGSRYEVTVMHTAARGDGTRLAREHIASFDAVAGCGGDGTLNEVMEALRDLPPEARKPMLCIPAGRPTCSAIRCSCRTMS